jgi:hypothetical protein
MNQRIKELSKEAGSVADATYSKGPDAIWLREYNKKFAELIVRECATEAHRRVCIEGNDNMIYAHLLEHFGVEE